MILKYENSWEYNVYNDNLKTFVVTYKLQNIVKNCFEELTSFVVEDVSPDNTIDIYDNSDNVTIISELTPDNIMAVLDEEGGYSEYDILTLLANQYLKDNDYFDQVVVVSSSGHEGVSEYIITFYTVTPKSQEDLKRFIRKNLDAYKEGYGEMVEYMLEKELEK